MGEKLILNTVLNFISRALSDGIKMESIIKSAVGYYDDETIILTKRILHTELNGPNRVVIRAKDEDNILEMSKTLVNTAAATKIVEAMKTSSPSLSVSLKESAYIGVVKRVPEDIDHSKLEELIPKCTKVTQCGKSRTYKVYFQTRSDLEVFLENSTNDYKPKNLFSFRAVASTATG